MCVCTASLSGFLDTGARITFSYFPDPLAQSYMEFETEHVEMTLSAGSALLDAIFLSAKSVFLGLNSLREIRHLNLGLIPKLIFTLLCLLNVRSCTDGGFIRKFSSGLSIALLILSL